MTSASNPYTADIARLQNNIAKYNEALGYLTELSIFAGDLQTDGVTLENGANTSFSSDVTGKTGFWSIPLTENVQTAKTRVINERTAASNSLAELQALSNAYEERLAAEAAAAAAASAAASRTNYGTGAAAASSAASSSRATTSTSAATSTKTVSSGGSSSQSSSLKSLGLKTTKTSSASTSVAKYRR